jgi:hypothetical protein
MRSYIFNSESGLFEREVPPRPWGKIALAIVVLVLCGVAAWEIYWREKGYIPDIGNSDDKFAEYRAKAQHAGPEYTIITGSSRAVFDIDLNTWREVTGNPNLIQLANEGCSPLPIVRDLVENTGFAGTMVISVAPDIFFVKGAMTDGWAQSKVDYYHKWSPAQQLEYATDLLVDPLLAFAGQSNLKLEVLLNELPIPDRPDRLSGYDRVPSFAFHTPERQALMMPMVVNDSALARNIQALWLGFNSRPKPLMQVAEYRAKTEAAFKGVYEPLPDDWKMRPGERDTFYQEINALLDTFRGRGGKVLFIRPPASGAYLPLEEHYFPRKETWDLLLERTGAPGVHFADYPELQGFDLPEWSHIRAEHAPPFTRELARIAMEKLRADDR